MAFIKNEKKPNVIIFKGRVMTFRIGLIINDIREKAMPPVIIVGHPPTT